MYTQATGQPLHPTCEDTAQLQQERIKLYTCNNSLPPMFDLAPLSFLVEDLIPDEDEIAKALSCLKDGKSPGASGITVDQLKFWMCWKKTKPKHWKLIVDIVQEAFRSGCIPLRLSQSICVLIPKNEKGDFAALVCWNHFGS